MHYFDLKMAQRIYKARLGGAASARTFASGLKERVMSFDARGKLFVSPREAKLPPLKRYRVVPVVKVRTGGKVSGAV